MPHMFGGPIYFNESLQQTLIGILLLIYFAISAVYVMLFLFQIMVLKKLIPKYYWLETNGYLITGLVTFVISYLFLLLDLFVFDGKQLNTCIGIVVYFIRGYREPVRFHLVYVLFLNISAILLNLVALWLLSRIKSSRQNIKTPDETLVQFH